MKILKNEILTWLPYLPSLLLIDKCSILLSQITHGVVIMLGFTYCMPRLKRCKLWVFYKNAKPLSRPLWNGFSERISEILADIPKATNSKLQHIMFFWSFCQQSRAFTGCFHTLPCTNISDDIQNTTQFQLKTLLMSYSEELKSSSNKKKRNVMQSEIK